MMKGELGIAHEAKGFSDSCQNKSPVPVYFFFDALDFVVLFPRRLFADAAGESLIFSPALSDFVLSFFFPDFFLREAPGVEGPSDSFFEFFTNELT